jgi:MYXO-CTERM domain-containing protein
MKLKHIALAVAAATSFGAAHAVNTAKNTAELFFLAYDTAGTTQFLYDTGATIASLINGTVSINVNFAADANWASFVTAAGGLSNVNWLVEGLQSQNGVNTKFIYGTLGAGASVTSLGSNTAFNGAFNNMNNAALASAAGALQSATVSAADASFLGNSVNQSKAYDQFTPAGVTQMSNVVGTTSVSFFGVANSNTSNGVSKITQFATPSAVAGFTTDGTLTIATAVVVPSVPEPESYGLALVGLLLAGAVARRRAA